MASRAAYLLAHRALRACALRASSRCCISVLHAGTCKTRVDALRIKQRSAHGISIATTLRSSDASAGV